MSITDVTASMVHVHWPSICLMLGQRSRRWSNIDSTLVQHAVFLIGTLLILGNSEMEIKPSRHKTSNQCWFNFGPPSTTLVQR